MPGLLMNRIDWVEPDATARIVRIGWAGGATTLLDLAPIIADGGVFTALGDTAVFTAVQVGPRGRSLIWPGDIDLDADAIWFDAHPQDRPAARPAAAE
ncbi:MAG: hypothetical protein RLY86_3041 [Pseudomonadota bacterium]|jgi:hypothetical protein